jgi:hypothetical protein
MNNRLLEKAQRNYPIGTEYIGLRDGDTETVRYTPRWVEGQDGSIEGGTDYIYRDGEWAKIVMPKKFEIGKWYRKTHWQSKAGKVKSYYNEEVSFSEYISEGGKHMYFNFENPSSDTFIEVPLSEIQQYLPINHPDNHSNIPEKWYMLLNSLSNKELEQCNEWRRCVCTSRAHASLEQHHILLNCHEDGSYYYGAPRVYDLRNESWANGIKEITFEEFKKHILNQNNKTVMTQQILTVSITEVLKIHSIACSSWKSIISSNYLPRVDNAQNITFNQHEIDAMFKAATETQLPTLENIFGKQVKEPTLKDIADGKPLFRENPNGGTTAMIEVRTGGSDLAYKAFWLNSTYNWELKKDNEGVLCLVPTPKR